MIENWAKMEDEDFKEYVKSLKRFGRQNTFRCELARRYLAWGEEIERLTAWKDKAVVHIFNKVDVIRERGEEIERLQVVVGSLKNKAGILSETCYKANHDKCKGGLGKNGGLNIGFSCWCECHLMQIEETIEGHEESMREAAAYLERDWIRHEDPTKQKSDDLQMAELLRARLGKK